jgi:multidrug efflux pump subunit AcrA (membrane-fusion protein)
MMKIVAAAVIPISLALGGCDQGRSQTQSAPPPPPKVTIAKPVIRMIADLDQYVGRFVSLESVEVRARVAGYLGSSTFRTARW